jgi:hypothetical protein
MKKLIPALSVAVLVAASVISVPSARALQYGSEPWANPPAEVQGVEAQGFHDGVEGARKDAENHRPPNVENRDEFRHPNVPHHDRRAYRDGFRRGYQAGVEHLMHEGRR